MTLVALILGCARPATVPPAQDPPLDRARAFSASRPEYERPLDDGIAPVEGVGTASAAACGSCHARIAEEWRGSTHALAWRDPQLQAELTKPESPTWLCVRCHTPLRVQQAEWPVDLEDGRVERPVLVPATTFDPALRDEGITCAACHVRDGVVHGPGLGGAAPHPVVADPSFRDDGLCLGCHQVVADYPGQAFACAFRTGDEWRSGPYAAAGTGCVDCHMPRVEEPVAEGGPVRARATHRWAGSGIPKVEGASPAFVPGVDVAATVVDGALRLVVTNARAGHALPTGDPERWVEVAVRFLDAAGAEVGPAVVREVGQRWEWFPAPRLLSDDRLLPGASRTEDLPVPAGAVRAVVTASNHRMRDEAAAFHDLVGRYPLSVEVQRLEVALGP